LGVKVWGLGWSRNLFHGEKTDLREVSNWSGQELIEGRGDREVKEPFFKGAHYGEINRSDGLQRFSKSIGYTKKISEEGCASKNET